MLVNTTVNLDHGDGMHLSHRPRPAAERRAGTSAPLAVQTGAAAPDGIAAPGASARERRTWSVLFLLCAAQFMVILDITVVNIALPSIGRTLHFAPADLQWVVT